MELISVSAAKSTWLFDLNDLNPRGKDVLADLLEWLKDTYGFEQYPKSLTDLDDTKGLAFKRGSFQAEEEIFVNVDFTIYLDGVSAITWSNTRETDAFIEDVLTSAAREFKLVYKPSMVRTRIYLSELIVRLDQPFGNLNPELNAFAAKVSQAAGRYHGSCEPAGLSFWADTQTVAKAPLFMVERKQNAPFSENRFSSRASMQTDDHRLLLGEFEQILAGS